MLHLLARRFLLQSQHCLTTPAGRLKRAVVSPTRKGRRTICDAIMTPIPGELTFSINRDLLAGGVTATDSDVREAMRFAYEHFRIVTEPGAVVGLAAVLNGQVPIKGRTVATVITGGNMDSARFAALLEDEDMTLDRRLMAEWLGTFSLLATVVGSGIMAERLAGGNVAVALLGNTIPTGAILVVLITIFGPISGAHFNPAVTLSFAMRREIATTRCGALCRMRRSSAVSSGFWPHM